MFVICKIYISTSYYILLLCCYGEERGFRVQSDVQVSCLEPVKKAHFLHLERKLW